ncbi:MAG TPA: amidohydrolase family protein [Pseudomonadales bacterium]|nr:amidohydrolase family protein [Pseudomonadales bacterium]
MMRLLPLTCLMFTAKVLAASALVGGEPGEEIINTVLAMGVAPPKVASPVGEEASGPYARLVIKNAFLIDGTGAPTQGPVTIVVEGDRIANIMGAGTGSLTLGNIQDDEKTRVLDATGKYVMPGFVNAHAHLGTPSHVFGGALTDPEYVTKLWLAHGITTVREPGSLMGLGWTLRHKQLSEQGKIAAPRIVAHALFPEAISQPDQARKWVRAVKKRGADGVKFLGAAPEAIEAAIEEAKSLGMKTMYHHSQVTVTRMNVLDSARLGLNSMEHWYGLPEAMFEKQTVQHYPHDYNYNDEQDRFSEAGRLWAQSAEPGSPIWQQTIQELIDLDFTINPTFSIYEANRDFMRVSRAEWLDEFTMPYMIRAFQPNPHVHGSYHFDWTSSHEADWRRNYQLWMQFINDYKNAGGRVTVGSDTGFIFGVYGFGYVRELEMFLEAGFHPLEVIKAATLNGAELLGMDKDIGTVHIGKKADLVIVNENPLHNFKVLYGTGHEILNRQSGEFERTTGVEYTIKDGQVFDAKRLREQVKTMVATQKAREVSVGNK